MEIIARQKGVCNDKTRPEIARRDRQKDREKGNPFLMNF